MNLMSGMGGMGGMYPSNLGSNCSVVRIADQMGQNYYKVSNNNFTTIDNIYDPNLGTMMNNMGKMSNSLEYYINNQNIYKFNPERNTYLSIYNIPDNNPYYMMSLTYEYQIRSYQNRIIVIRSKNLDMYYDPLTNMQLYRTGY